jgi:hypothetical protein
MERLVARMRAAEAGDREGLLDALICAGELESALADDGAAAALKVARLADLLAKSFVDAQRPCREAARCAEDLLRDDLPPEVTISPPEGFAFYALSPADFAAGLSSLPARCRHIGVIGIRSIGTTLSALATADLKNRGADTARITVRPAGHPFERTTTLTPEQQRWVAGFHQCAACFLIVDEGPGMSGSSFLSVAEALEREGVPPGRIFLGGSRNPDLNALRASNAAQRWRRYHWHCVTPQVHQQYRDHVYFSADFWRARHFAAHEWPACWRQMERLKFLSPDGETLYKFEGLGRFGREVRERAQRVAELGFGCRAENGGGGMTAYAYVDGCPLRAGDLSNEIVNRIAEYCARRREFLAPDSPRQQLPEIVAFNLDQEFGAAPAIPVEELICDRPIIADGQMHPHEWMRDKNGHILKLDVATHGDDHFFPGPTDIAWDLAGAIVEWGMETDAANLLINNYRKLTADDPSTRMPAYVLAYSVFRMSYSKMAAEAEKGTAEAIRLENAYRFYRDIVERQLAGSTAPLSLAA